MCIRDSHPTEIRATLEAARQRFNNRRVWAVWQPHTFTRTKLLQDEFAQSFGEADKVIGLDIFRSREVDTLGMSTDLIVQKMDHKSAVYIPTKEDAANYILDRILQGDVIITLGAGDRDLVGKLVLDGLKSRLTNHTVADNNAATQVGQL